VAERAGLQELVDRLSERVGRPVLIDDRELEPLAYSRQTGALDVVRTTSVLERGVSEPVRAALQACGIARATGPLHCPADAALGMSARLCVPIGRAGYLWIIEDAPLDAAGIAAAVDAAQRAAVLLAPQQELIEALAAGRGALPAGLRRPLVVRTDGVADWLASAGEPPPAGVGESHAFDGAGDVPLALRRARVALAAGGGSWEALGAQRLLAHVDAPAALADAPPRVLRLLEDEHATLRTTLQTYLDLAGDVKATADALSLHRAGLYYRLNRIAQLTGLDLRRGDDRLLAQLVLALGRNRP
jgi:hypothetical protein